jgi:hypothetical protein
VKPAQVDEQHPVERHLAGEKVPGVDSELGFPAPLTLPWVVESA